WPPRAPTTKTSAASWRASSRRCRPASRDPVPRTRITGMNMDVIDVIHAKRDGAALTGEQIDWVIDAYTKGVVADEQMAALAMAIFLNGMNREEVARWTMAMVNSGDR